MEPAMGEQWCLIKYPWDDYQLSFTGIIVNLYVTYCHVLKAAGRTRLLHYDPASTSWKHRIPS
jgi:hypothetical protein